MLPVDASLLASILAPVVLVSFLVLMKIKQEKTGRRLSKTSNMQTNRDGEFLAETNQNECPQYFGYLHDVVRPHPLFKTNPEGSSFPKECYGCPKLTECFYSPTIVQRIYGSKDEAPEQTI